MTNDALLEPLTSQNATPEGILSSTAEGTGVMRLLVEFVVLCAALVPMMCLAMGVVTVYHFRRLYLNPTFETWKLKFNKVCR